jgi:hypothetical protein
MKTARFLLIFFTLFILTSAMGQRVSYPTIKDLKGSTRSLREVSFTASNNQGRVQKGEEIKKVQYLFDSKRNLQEMDEYTPDGEIDERYTTNYDENGNLVEETQYSSDSLQNRFTYRYDNKGNRIGWMSYVTASDTSTARGSYTYDDKGRITSDTLYNTKGKRIQWSSYTFDDQSHVTKEVHYYTSGEKLTDTYDYDMNGNKIMDTKMRADGSTKSITKYKCNGEGKISEVNVLSDSGSDYEPLEKCKYDTYGNRIEDLKFAEGKVYSKSVYTYDALGNNTEESLYRADGSLVVKMIYKYDDQKNRIEKDLYKSDTTLFEKWTYRYDAQKNRVEEDFYGTVDPKLDNFAIKVQIEYDKAGNWVKETGFQNNEPVSITEREIVYY